MTQKILVLGSQHNNTQNFSKSVGLEKSILITPNNMYDNFSVGHTSIQDMLFYEQFDELIKQVDSLYWSGPDKDEFWNDEFYTEYLWWIKKVQSKTNKFVNFPEFNFDPYNLLYPKIKVNPDDAVFVGCSWTAGVGLEDPKSQHFSYIISKHFNKNCVNLGVGGSSIGYAFERLSNIDFYENQIVVLQLTHPYRWRYYSKDKKQQIHINVNQPNNVRPFIEVFNQEFLLYELIQKLKLFQKIADAKKLKFAFFLIDYKGTAYSYTDQLYFYDFKSFIPYGLMQEYYIDVGTDDIHPGPKSNEYIAKTVINFLETQYK